MLRDLEPRQSARVLRVQGAAHAVFQALTSAGQQRNAVELDAGADAARAQQRSEMAGEPEAGDVGAGAGGDGSDDAARSRIRSTHRRDGRFDPVAARFAEHVGAPEDPRAERLREDQLIAGREAGLAQQRVAARSVAPDGEADAELGAGHGMAADERDAVDSERGPRAGENLEQCLLAAIGRGIGNGDHREREARRDGLRPEIARGVDGGDAADEPRVVGERANRVDARHDDGAIRRRDGGHVIGFGEAEDDGIVARDAEPRERARERRRADLRGAAAARHVRHPGHRRERGCPRAVRRQHLEPLHEAAVDPVLQGEHRPALGSDAPLGADRGAVADVQQREEVSLRPVRTQRRRPGDPRAQVARQHGTLTHGVDTGLRQRRVERGAVPDREEIVVSRDLQRRTDADEPRIVVGQGRGGEPGGRRGAGDPDDFVANESRAVVRRDQALLGVATVGLDARDPRARPDRDAARGEPSRYAFGHARRRFRQHARAAVDQRDLGVGLAGGGESGAKGERELDAPGTGADDGDPRAPALQRARQQRVDLLDEAPDWPRREGMLDDAGQAQPDDGRADIERRDVETQRRAPGELDPLGDGIESGRRSDDDRGAGPARERAHVDRQLAGAVLAGDEAGYHAGVHRIGAVDDEGRPDVRQRLHREPCKHLDVRMPAADEDQVSHRCGAYQPRFGCALATIAGYRSAMRAVRALVSFLLLATLACVPTGGTRQAAQRVAPGDLEGARIALEQRRHERPRDVDARIALGEVYYRIARAALDGEHDERRYLEYLERSVSEFVTAMELSPRDDRPHLYLAVMDTYRGDLDRALRGLQNTRRLSRSPIAYTNIAEIYVYRGDLAGARRWNDRGVRAGAPYGAVLFNDMLIRWHEGDLDAARRIFARLKRSHPDMIRTINLARLPEEPRQFEDFAGYCCASPACGPYLAHACSLLSIATEQRQLSKEATLEELRIEMERVRRMRRVYDKDRTVDIEIE